MTRSYEESFKILAERIDITGDPMPGVKRVPRADDDKLGPSLFRMLVEDVELDGLSIPGLYVGRSELTRVSFRGSDLHLSAINWSDVIECDFREADLSGADLRASKFIGCDFSSANLAKADLRASTITDCEFSEANFKGALLRHRRRLLGFIPIGSGQDDLPLSPSQREEAVWTSNAPEPRGG